MRILLLAGLCLTMLLPQTPRPTTPETDYLLKPAHVFDGESAQLHDNWAVLVHGDKIVRVGPAGSITPPDGAKVIDLPGLTLMPGLIEAHSHVLLHPYSETPWNDQVARESLSLRARARRIICATRCKQVSPRFAISVRKAQVTQTLV
jgi:imidazolonepropionase-like amidohydrolase